MKTSSRINKLIMIGILFYIILYSYSGIFTKLAITFNLLSFKKVLPEISLFILLFLVFINIIIEEKFKLDLLVFIAVMYFTFNVVINLYSVDNLNQVIFTLRDIYLPFFMLLIVFNINFNTYEKRKLISYLNKLMIIKIIAGLVLAYLQVVNGWEWSSRFYTGYSFYATDPLTGIKISHINWLLRPPTITGNHVTFGILNVFAAFIFIEHSSYNKSKLNLIKHLICIINVILSTSRTAIVMLLIIYIYYFIANGKFKRNIILVPLGILTSVYILYKSNTILLSTSSIIDRINNAWYPIFHDLSAKDFILGKNIYSVGHGLKFVEEYSSYDFLAFGVFDNMYLYIFASYGIVGMIFFVMLVKRITALSQDRYFKALTYAFCISGIFTNLFQGRAFFYIYFILFSMVKYHEDIIQEL